MLAKLDGATFMPSCRRSDRYKLRDKANGELVSAFRQEF